MKTHLAIAFCFLFILFSPFMTFTREVEGLVKVSVIGLRVPLEWMIAFYLLALGVFTIIMGVNYSRKFTEGAILRIRRYNLWPDAKRLWPWLVVGLALHAVSGGIVYYFITLLFFAFYSLFKAAFIAMVKPQYLCLLEGVLLQNTGLGRREIKLNEFQEKIESSEKIILKFEDNLDNLELYKNGFDAVELEEWLNGGLVE